MSVQVIQTAASACVDNMQYLTKNVVAVGCKAACGS